MKKSIPLLWVFLTLFLPSSSGQYYRPENATWVMGKYAGLDFTTGPDPVAITSNMDGLNNEGCASVCDQSGHLLFYTNGQRIWNRNHTVMPNGATLPGIATATQGCLIVPAPGSGSIYYLFLLAPSANGYQLRCNRINMSLNGGMGDVDMTFNLNNTVLEDSLSEKMTAIPGCNGSIWIVVHRETSEQFLAFQVTASGIGLTPALSTFPTAYSSYFYGVLKGSADGTRLLRCSGGLSVFSFNRATGFVSNPVLLDNADYYGGAFSPDGSKVYARSFSTYSRVYQFDLNSPDPYATKTGIGPFSDPANYGWADMKLGPDGRIYVGCNTGVMAPPVNGFRLLSRINNPNSPGMACNFQDTVPGIDFSALAPGSVLAIGLPNDVVVARFDTFTSQRVAMDTIICNFPESGYILQAPPGFSNYSWDNASMIPSRTVLQEGTYWLKYIDGACIQYTDTFRIKGAMPPLLLEFTNGILGTTEAYDTYQWYKDGAPLTGSTGQSCVASGSGWYSVAVSNVYGCTDSAAYEVTGMAIVDPSGLKKQVCIYPNPANENIYIKSPVPVNASLMDLAGKQLIRLTNAASLDLGPLAEGLYLLQIGDSDNHLITTEKVIIRHKD